MRSSKAVVLTDAYIADDHGAMVLVMGLGGGWKITIPHTALPKSVQALSDEDLCNFTIIAKPNHLVWGDQDDLVVSVTKLLADMPQGRQLSDILASAPKTRGERLKEKYGDDYFKRMGQKGGSATHQKHGVNYYSDIGKQGGASLREHYGIEHFVDIGKKGGSSPRLKH